MFYVQNLLCNMHRKLSPIMRRMLGLICHYKTERGFMLKFVRFYDVFVPVLHLYPHDPYTAHDPDMLQSHPHTLVGVYLGRSSPVIMEALRTYLYYIWQIYLSPRVMDPMIHHLDRCKAQNLYKIIIIIK